MINYFVRYMWFIPEIDDDCTWVCNQAQTITEARKMVREAFLEIQKHTGADSSIAGLTTLGGSGINCSKPKYKTKDTVIETFGVYIGPQDLGEIDLIITNQENEEDIHG